MKPTLISTVVTLSLLLCTASIALAAFTSEAVAELGNLPTVAELLSASQSGRTAQRSVSAPRHANGRQTSQYLLHPSATAQQRASGSPARGARVRNGGQPESQGSGTRTTDRSVSTPRTRFSESSGMRTSPSSQLGRSVSPQQARQRTASSAPSTSQPRRVEAGHADPRYNPSAAARDQVGHAEAGNALEPLMTEDEWASHLEEIGLWETPPGLQQFRNAAGQKLDLYQPLSDDAYRKLVSNPHAWNVAEWLRLDGPLGFLERPGQGFIGPVWKSVDLYFTLLNQKDFQQLFDFRYISEARAMYYVAYLIAPETATGRILQRTASDIWRTLAQRRQGKPKLWGNMLRDAVTAMLLHPDITDEEKSQVEHQVKELIALRNQAPHDGPQSQPAVVRNDAWHSSQPANRKPMASSGALSPVHEQKEATQTKNDLTARLQGLDKQLEGWRMRRQEGSAEPQPGRVQQQPAGRLDLARPNSADQLPSTYPAMSSSPAYLPLSTDRPSSVLHSTALPTSSRTMSGVSEPIDNDPDPIAAWLGEFHARELHKKIAEAEAEAEKGRNKAAEARQALAKLRNGLRGRVAQLTESSP